MPVPAMLATAAACGSLVTTMKSGWELSRMIRQKLDAKQAEEDSVRVYRRLRRALHSGRMSEKEYDHWYEKFLVAESEKNLSGLRKIRAHLRIVYEHTPSEKGRRYHSSSSGRSSSSSQTYHRHESDKRNRSVHFEPRRPTVYVPDPPKRHHDIEPPPSAGSIEYFPMNEKQEPVVPHLARLQRSSSVSYSPSESSSNAHTKQSVSTPRYKREEVRGRSRSRENTYDDSTDSSDELHHEKLGYRSRR